VPSLLDVIGTIFDTAGIFYVLVVSNQDQCISQSNAQRLRGGVYLPHQHNTFQAEDGQKPAFRGAANFPRRGHHRL
jgi:hypothetical protein